MSINSQSSNLDFLRSLAVIMVFVFHYVRTLGTDWIGPVNFSAFGLAGVLIFFVHTSLVLMLSMERQALPLKALVPSFYVRRAFRIYPLSMAAIILVLLARIPPTPWSGPFTLPSARDIISNLALTQNLTRSPSIIGPLWSLPYEVQMYIVLPIVFVMVKSLSRAYIVLLLLVALMSGEVLLLGHFKLTRYIPAFFAASSLIDYPNALCLGFLVGHGRFAFFLS